MIYRYSYQEKNLCEHLGAVVILVILLALELSPNDLRVAAFQPTKLPPLHQPISNHASLIVFESPVQEFAYRGPSRYGTRQNIINSNIPLGMTTESSDESSNKSKRRRFRESLKKIVFYPKNKIQSGLRRILKRDACADIDRQTSAETVEECLISEDSGGKVTLAEEYGVSWRTNGEVNGNAPSSTFASPTLEIVEESATNIEEQEAIRTTEPDTSSSEEVSEATPTTVDFEDAAVTGTASSPSSGLRSATTQSVDLTGKWELIVSDEFRTSYDRYLKLLGQPSLVRSVALSIIGMTTEETVQSDSGRELKIRGRNVRGNWERTLRASSEDEPLVVPIITADKETVQSECWWEDDGSVHRSWLRGVQKYGGGNFESKRFLEGDGTTLVCESTFHPDDAGKEPAKVVWKFRRVVDQASS